MIGLHHFTQICRTASFTFSFAPPHCSPCTIRSNDFLAAGTVRYDLVAFIALSCTISILEPLIL